MPMATTTSGSARLVRLSGKDRVWLVTIAMLGVSAALCAFVVANLAPLHRASLPFLALVSLFAMAEIFVVHFELGRESHTFSLVEIPIVLGLLFVDPLLLVAAHVIGAGAALALYRRQAPVKLLYNVAAFALEDCLALLIFHG